MSSGIIYAYHFEKDNITRLTSYAEIQAAKEGFLWLHLDQRSKEAQEFVRKDPTVNDVALEALFESESRPRMLDFDKGYVLTFRSLNLSPEQDQEDMVHLHVWIDANRLITIRGDKVYLLDELNTRLDKGYMPKNQGEILVAVMQSITAKITDYAFDLSDQVDNLEDQMIAGEGKSLRMKLSLMRRKIILIKRYIVPQRDLLWSWSNEPVAYITDQNRRYFRDAYDKTLRIIEDLDATRDRAQITQEELNNRIQEQMNKTMYTLSIVATIFLPLSFFTGLLGINVGGIPGMENPIAFWIVTAFLSLMAVFEYLYFKKNNWL